MVAILVIAHEPLAGALVAAARHVYSRDQNTACRLLRAFDVPADAQVGESADEAGRVLAEIDQGQGVLVLTDVVGATPANVAARLARPGRVAVLAGASLPMLLRALCYSDANLEAVQAKAAEGAARGVQPLPPAGAGPQTGGAGNCSNDD